MAFTHSVADFSDRHTKPGGVDFTERRASPPTSTGMSYFSPARTDDFREQKCAAFVLAQPALELPADQGMKFRILVDAAIDRVSRPRSSRRAICSCKSAGAFCIVTWLHCGPPISRASYDSDAAGQDVVITPFAIIIL